MKLWEKEGKTEFAGMSGGIVSFLAETRDGIPYCYCFDPTEGSEAEARVKFEEYIGSDWAKKDVEEWKMRGVAA